MDVLTDWARVVERLEQRLLPERAGGVRPAGRLAESDRDGGSPHPGESSHDGPHATGDRPRLPLPGVEGHVPMSPQPRAGWVPGKWPSGMRDGAGLLLLFPVERRPHIVLTRRAEAMRAHASQIALPGGAVDPGETFEQAALREAHEEVSLKPDAVRVLGRLSPLHIPVSKFVLHPVVGVVDARPTFVPEPQEVARVLEVPLAELGSVEHQRSDRRDFKGQTYVVPFFDVLDERVWGATAMILSEFLTLLERPPQPQPPQERGASPAMKPG